MREYFTFHHRPHLDKLDDGGVDQVVTTAVLSEKGENRRQQVVLYQISASTKKKKQEKKENRNDTDTPERALQHDRKKCARTGTHKKENYSETKKK